MYSRRLKSIFKEISASRSKRENRGGCLVGEEGEEAGIDDDKESEREERTVCAHTSSVRHLWVARANPGSTRTYIYIYIYAPRRVRAALYSVRLVRYLRPLSHLGTCNHRPPRCQSWPRPLSFRRPPTSAFVLRSRRALPYSPPIPAILSAIAKRARPSLHILTRRIRYGT